MVSSTQMLSAQGVFIVFKVGFAIFAALYFFFSLIIIRQVSLMAETVRTQYGGLLRIISILFALLSLAVLIFFVRNL